MNKTLGVGFKQLMRKSVIFLAILALIQLILASNPSEEFILSHLPKLFIIVDLASAFMASLVLLFIIYKDKILNIRKFDINRKDSVIFGILAVLVFIFYIFFTKFISNNFSLIEDSVYSLVILRYAFLFILLVFLMAAIFGKEFIKNMSRKGVIIFLGLGGLIYFLITLLHNLWYFFSYVITKGVYFLLSINFNAVINLSKEIPLVGIDIFVVRIAESCSGISSMFLFMFLYVFAVSYDWKVLNKKKAVLMFIPGVFSVFCLNILRIYLIILIGAYYSKSFAVGVFHTGISGILFVIYFAIFWKMSYKWMKK